ncbi:hypothetical protein KAX75_13575 [candidate division WOR-3 bacterium]|nr:hypothetical protein [candidate division WOR-3 bacterium]
MAKCTACNGTGRCSHCNGTGLQGTQNIKCGFCYAPGSQSYPEKGSGICRECHGTGEK